MPRSPERAHQRRRNIRSSGSAVGPVTPGVHIVQRLAGAGGTRAASSAASATDPAEAGGTVGSDRRRRWRQRVEPVGVHVDAAAERDEPLAAPDDEQLLVVALGRAGVILLRVAVGNPVDRPDRLVVQPGVVRVDQPRRVPEQDPDLHAALAGPREQVEQARARAGQVDPRVAPPAEQVDEVLVGLRRLDGPLDGGEGRSAVDQRLDGVAGQAEAQHGLPVATPHRGGWAGPRPWPPDVDRLPARRDLERRVEFGGCHRSPSPLSHQLLLDVLQDPCQQRGSVGRAGSSAGARRRRTPVSRG